MTPHRPDTAQPEEDGCTLAHEYGHHLSRVGGHRPAGYEAAVDTPLVEWPNLTLEQKMLIFEEEERAWSRTGGARETRVRRLDAVRGAHARWADEVPAAPIAADLTAQRGPLTMEGMDLAELRAASEERFRRWALDECAKEVGLNLVHLKTIRGSWVLGTVEFIERWPPEDQAGVMQARLASDDAHLSARQRELLRLVGGALSSGFGPRYMQMLEDYAAGRYRVPRTVIRRALKRDLAAALGRPEQLDGAEWKHRTEVGKWTVVTEVDSAAQRDSSRLGMW